MANTQPWQPLALLENQFRANLAALARRNAHLADRIDAVVFACPYMIQAGTSILNLARQPVAGPLEILPNPLPASAAGEIAQKLCPTGHLGSPIVVAGLDQGWLWRTLYELPVSTPAAPGHKPPLYFLASDLERLRVAMHLHDWRKLLADSRVQLFCGHDAVDQLEQFCLDRPAVPFPRLSVTVEPSLWPAKTSIDSIYQHYLKTMNARMAATSSRLNQIYANFTSDDLVNRMRDGQPLRILGITSRFTTFLQYSMRDWLKSMETLGHTTHLVIEQADHECNSPSSFAGVCEDFQPDLILIIDHYRAELPGLPAAVPCVMWVQDRLPNIYNAKAGASQGPRDYVIGQGRIECVHAYGYPSSRFMPTLIGTNEARFARTSDSIDESAYACDVSFVSHASTPAEVTLRSEIERLNNPQATRLLEDIYGRLKSIYDVGNSVSQQSQIESIVSHSLHDTQTTTADPRPLIDFFTHKINNALFRHQTIEWLADMGVDLRLYGRGWENHPNFARYARGVADNEKQLAAIHRASKINMQISPFGSAHQRVFDGLAAGGFFLLRAVPGDRFDRHLQDLWMRVSEAGIRSDAELLSRGDSEMLQILKLASSIEGSSLIGRGYDFVNELAITAAEGFTRSSSTLWPEYDRVSYSSRDQLAARVHHYLSNPKDRTAVAESMRQRVIDTLTYTAISKRMLDFIAADLSIESTARMAA